MSETIILRARHVLPMHEPAIENGAVAIQGDTIIAVGAADDGFAFGHRVGDALEQVRDVELHALRSPPRSGPGRAGSGSNYSPILA